MDEVKYKERKPICPMCDKWPPLYSDKHDANYCPDCNIWLEDQCGDDDCEFCSNRPVLPLDNQ